jgi:KUP system potassium uptake protein
VAAARAAAFQLRQREDQFVAWVLDTPPIRLAGAAGIFTVASTGIPLALTHHLRHNRVLHERVLLIASITTDEPRVSLSNGSSWCQFAPASPA